MLMRRLEVKLKVVESRLAEADACQAWCPEVNNEKCVQTAYVPFILMDLFIIKWSRTCLKLSNDWIKILIVRLN